MIIGIVAVSRNLAIGRNGTLPWHYPSDMSFFRRTTTNNAVLMGSNTWNSIGKVLPNRLNLVLSRTAEIEARPGLVVVRSVEEVAEINKYLKCDLFLIGGAKTYSNLSSIVDQWIVTEIPEEIQDADTFMNSDFLSGFSLSDSQHIDGGLMVKTYNRSLTQDV